MTTAIYRAVGAVLREKDAEADLVGDEGGYGPRLQTNAQAIDLILEAVLAHLGPIWPYGHHGWAKRTFLRLH